MRMWPNPISTSPLLTGSDGVLVSVSIHIDARDLESLLEILAKVDFPINPQVYHDAAFVYFFDDGSERIEPTILVEFPAYTGQMNALRRALESFNFDSERVEVTGMLDELHSEDRLEPAPPGAPYRARQRRKQVGLAHALSFP